MSKSSEEKGKFPGLWQSAHENTEQWQASEAENEAATQTIG